MSEKHEYMNERQTEWMTQNDITCNKVEWNEWMNEGTHERTKNQIKQSNMEWNEMDINEICCGFM